MDARMTPFATYVSTPPTSISFLGQEPTAETPIRFRGVAALFQALDKKEGDFAVAEGVSARSFAAIEKAREARDTHERLHYRSNDQQLLISRPTQQHERVGTGLISVLINALGGIGVPYTAYALGAATKHTSASGGSGGSGEGDQTFIPNVRDQTPNKWPTLVVEVGVSQSPNDLRRKMAWWFSASNHEVKIVLLVKVVRSARALVIDKYIKDVPHSRPGAMATRSLSSLVPQLQQSIIVAPRPGTAPADNLYNAISAPLVLEFALLFLRPKDPALGERDVELPADGLAWVANQTFR